MNEDTKAYTIRLTDSEVEWIQRITMVDAVAPAALSILRKAICEAKGAQR